jgi:polyketide biosynthesis acyl carrier protein
MSKEEIFNLIISHVKKLIPELEKHDFKYTDSLRELGANSIDRAEILTLTMESIDLDIPRVDLFGAKNINDLVDTFYAKLHSTV